ncbi:MAG TPA: GNAT family N-acetyltransferase [Firmicutes bacterium]|nr:GNAT family N-acetyltransferase [Bacillota bacterium]
MVFSCPVRVHGASCTYTNAVRDIPAVRDSFNALTRATYGFDFRRWQALGGWDENYIPHALLEGDTVVANVSVNRMALTLSGRPARGVQLGTVMTAESCRGRGFARCLMERVLAEWTGRCDLLYLFANDSAREFYPRFGFVPVEETQHSLSLPPEGAAPPAALRPLDMDRPEDRLFLMQRAQAGNPYAEVRVSCGSLALFYACEFLKDRFFALPAWDLAGVLSPTEEGLLVSDLFGRTEAPLSAVLRSLTGGRGGRVVLGFTPADRTGCIPSPYKEEDCTLFVLRGQERYFQENAVMFPALSHA